MLENKFTNLLNDLLKNTVALLEEELAEEYEALVDVRAVVGVLADDGDDWVTGVMKTIQPIEDVYEKAKLVGIQVATGDLSEVASLAEDLNYGMGPLLKIERFPSYLIMEAQIVAEFASFIADLVQRKEARKGN